jgi:hypothetical protein
MKAQLNPSKQQNTKRVSHGMLFPSLLLQVDHFSRYGMPLNEGSSGAKFVICLQLQKQTNS